MSEAEERQRVVAIARTWLGTPYHHMAQLKGVGVDCATLLRAVYEEAGVVGGIEIAPYSPDWHLHQDRERYLEIVSAYAHEIEGPPGPGDVAVWQFGRVFSHGAIVVAWPEVIHAYTGRVCMMENVDAAMWLQKIFEMPAQRGQLRPRKFFSHWGAA